MFSVRLPINNRLLVIKFWGESKVVIRFSTTWGLITPTPRFSRVNSTVNLIKGLILAEGNAKLATKYLDLQQGYKI